MKRWWKLQYLTGVMYSTDEAEIDAAKAELMSDHRQIKMISYKSSLEMPDDWEPDSVLHGSGDGGGFGGAWW